MTCDEGCCPKEVLDLFCGAGGAAVGLKRAWPHSHITGVDISPQKHYPFDFVQADAMTYQLVGYDFIWASPPCQAYSRAFRHLALLQPMLIDSTRIRLQQSGVAWVIENVAGSGLPDQDDLFGAHGAMVCGSGLGLRVWRHRYFECHSPIMGTGCNHREPAMNPHNVTGRARIYAELGRCDPERPWRAAMGVSWMTKHEGREAIPPAYSEYIARQMHAT